MVRAQEAVARTDLYSVQLRDVLHAPCIACFTTLTILLMCLTSYIGDRKSDDGDVGMLVCPKRSRNEIRAQWYDGNETVAPSQRSIRNLKMKSGIVHLGHPDFQEARLCSPWATDQEAALPNELQIQNLPETLPSPICAIQEESEEDQPLQGPLEAI